MKYIGAAALLFGILAHFALKHGVFGFQIVQNTRELLPYHVCGAVGIALIYFGSKKDKDVKSDKDKKK